MGWETSNRRQRLPANWEALRAQRLKIDGYRCTERLPGDIRCPAPASDVDHVIAMTDDHRLEALQSLCRVHHARKSGREGGQAWAAIRGRMKAQRLRPAERHPGLIGD